MQLREMTDQAFRCVLYLCGCQNPRSIEEISKAVCVPEPCVRKVMLGLKKAGIVYGKRGRAAGYALAKSPEKIYPYDIVSVFEETIRINRCLEEDSYCSRKGPKNGCPVREYLNRFQNLMEKHLKEMNFLELYEETKEYQEKVRSLEASVPKLREA